MTDVIVRKWEAMIARSDIAAWKETFMERVFPHMKGIDGFKGVTVFAAREGDPCIMTVQTNWRDMEAVVRFAGDDPARTYLPDFMVPFFPKYEAFATFHDQVLAEGAA